MQRDHSIAGGIAIEMPESGRLQTPAIATYVNLSISSGTRQPPVPTFWLFNRHLFARVSMYENLMSVDTATHS
jgi:hypothetical protein